MVRRGEEELLKGLPSFSVHQSVTPGVCYMRGWFTGLGLGACICTKYIRRLWLKGPREVLAALPPLALGRKMKNWGVWKHSPKSLPAPPFFFFWMRSSCSDFLQLFVKSDSVMGMTSFALHSVSAKKIKPCYVRCWLEAVSGSFPFFPGPLVSLSLSFCISLCLSLFLSFSLSLSPYLSLCFFLSLFLLLLLA